MVVSTIYLTRHGFRVNWTTDPITGETAANILSPTRIPADTPLTAYGVKQSEQLGTALCALQDPPITRIYSSPYYRCLQTLKPFVELSRLEIRGDNGLGEWYGLAQFAQPSPAKPRELRRLFPSYDLEYEPSIIPSRFGETPKALHDRCAYALSYIISRADAEDFASSKERNEQTAILICSHAAPLIAAGRAMTGRMPDSILEEDFKTYTCGISKFVRRKTLSYGDEMGFPSVEAGMEIPTIDWRNGKGVAGGWDCVVNSDCRHLKGGEERGWHFQGDEAFEKSEVEDVKPQVIHVHNDKHAVKL